MTKLKTRLPQIFLNLLILFLLFLMIYPLAMAVWNAFKSDLGFNYSRWYPTLPLRINNVVSAFKSVWRYILNTIFVASVGVSGSLIVASLAAYAFARMQFLGKKFLYMAVLALMMVPGVLTLVPSFTLYRSIVGLDNYLVLILPQIVGPVMGVFLLTTFFGGLPKDFFEAAKIDGAGEAACYAKIAAPLSMPIMGTLAIMQIVGIWNDYLWPMITIQDYNKFTISAGLLISFTKQYSTNYPVTFAGYLVASTPLILLFIFANKYYIQGLISSSIKM